MAKEDRRPGDRWLKGWGPSPGTRWRTHNGEAWVVIEAIVLEGDLLSSPRWPIILLRNEETGDVVRQAFYPCSQSMDLPPNPSGFYALYKPVDKEASAPPAHDIDS